MTHVLPVVVAAVLFNTTRFIAISSLGPRLQKIPAYLKFLLFFQAFHPLTTTGLAPLILLLILNFKIYRRISLSNKYFRAGSSRTKEYHLAKTMMVLVIVFIVLNMPRLVLGLNEVLHMPALEKCFKQDYHYHQGKITYIVDSWARFLVILNSSVNFIIYCLVGSDFQSKLKETLHISGSFKNSLRRPQISVSGDHLRCCERSSQGGKGGSNCEESIEGTTTTRIPDNAEHVSFSSSPNGLSKVNQHLGDAAWKTVKNGNDKEENEEERILEKREMGIGFEDEARNGNGSKDSNWNCVEAKMNVVVETHF